MNRKTLVEQIQQKKTYLEDFIIKIKNNKVNLFRASKALY